MSGQVGGWIVVAWVESKEKGRQVYPIVVEFY